MYIYVYVHVYNVYSDRYMHTDTCIYVSMYLCIYIDISIYYRHTHGLTRLFLSHRPCQTSRRLQGHLAARRQVCVYVYIIYIYIYIYLSIYLSIHLSIYPSISLYIQIHTHTHTHVYAYVHVYVCMYIYTAASTAAVKVEANPNIARMMNTGRR